MKGVEEGSCWSATAKPGCAAAGTKTAPASSSTSPPPRSGWPVSPTPTAWRWPARCGTTAVKEHGEDRHTRHPVMTPEMIRQLPDGSALVILRQPVPHHRPPMDWKDPAYKRARRTGHAIAGPPLSPQAVPLPTAVPVLRTAPHLSPDRPVAMWDDQTRPGRGHPPAAAATNGAPQRWPWRQRAAAVRHSRPVICSRATNPSSRQAAGRRGRSGVRRCQSH